MKAFSYPVSDFFTTCISCSRYYC